jgi:predicted dehydrogenase
MTIHRRHFIQTTLGAAAALGVARRGLAATGLGDIRVAQIGFRGQGSGHIGNLAAAGNHVVALCDVDEQVLKNKVDELKAEGRTVDAYTDYRKLLERKDIDAVSIATPNHTHALIAIAAAEAGKDVYVEKPVSHNVWEGRQIVAAARKNGRCIQTGTQSRSSKGIRQAVEFVQGGELGAVRYALATCYKGRPGIGKLSEPLKIPESIDYDLWCGPAEKRELYRPQLHYDWHWDFNTGCGDLGNQGIHQMDIARWFLGESTLAPRVFSVGGRVGYDDAGDTPNTQIIFHAYERAPLVFEVRGLPRAKRFQGDNWKDRMDQYRGCDIGVIVQCEKGYVLVPNYSQAVVFDNSGEEIKRWDEGGRHHENWLKAVAARDPKLLAADIQEGHLSSALCHAGNVSYRVGKKARLGEIAERVAGNELLAVSFDRMLGHLRANDVDVDGDVQLTCGEWIEVDPKTCRARVVQCSYARLPP